MERGSGMFRKMLNKGFQRKVFSAIISFVIIYITMLPVKLNGSIDLTWTGPWVGPSWPGLTIDYTNSSNYNMTVKGLRFKTPSFAGYTCWDIAGSSSTNLRWLCSAVSCFRIPVVVRL